MQNIRSLSVVIPAHNEEMRLGKTVNSIVSFLTGRMYHAEIVIVDDGSIDGTLREARRLEAASSLVRVLSYPKNMGKGFAVKTGVMAASRNSILFTDADLSTPIEDLDRLWLQYDRGYPIVIASRACCDSRLAVKQPLYRVAMGRIFNAFISSVAVRGIRDTQCGCKLFEAGIAKKLFSRLVTEGFAFDVEVLMRARKMGLKVAEVGVSWSNAPGSQVHPIRDSLRMLKEVLQMRKFINVKHQCIPIDSPEYGGMSGASVSRKSSEQLP